MAFRVALTFDAEHPDRPHLPDGAERVLDTLAAHAVRATFFLQGRWVESEPLLARRIVADGHLVGNHSHYHARMGLLTAAGFRTDVSAAESAIRRYAGVDPRPLFRFPFGSAANDDARIALLDSMGYRHVGWHVEPKEWRTRATVARVASEIRDGVMEHGDGAIVLLHTWPRPVARSLLLAIPALVEAGASFVGIDELDRVA